MGKFNMSADVSSGDGVHEASNLEVQLGTNRLTGSLRWEDQAPRPFLTGNLSSDRLTLDELLAPHQNLRLKPGGSGCWIVQSSLTG
jgi:hypothetical protein